MYLIYCAIVFAVMAVPKRHRFEWAVLAVLMVLLWGNKELLGKNGDALYVIRASLVCVAAFLLASRQSFIGFYQAIILLCFLIAYAALAYDIAAGEDLLIYSSFGAWVHGLVACQLIGVFPTVWDCCHRLYSSGRVGRKYLPRSERA